MACAGLFGVGTIASGKALLPGASELRLDKDGFAWTVSFRTHRVGWKQAKDFGVWKSRHTKLVTYNGENPASPVMAALNTAIADRNASLPDTYGFAAEDLAQLMSQWRALALRQT